MSLHDPTNESELSSKRSRIHFPAQIPANASSTHPPSDNPHKVSASNPRASLGLTSSPLTSQKAGTSTVRRRRVQSVDTVDAFVESPRPQRKLVHGLLTPPRGIDSLTNKTFETVQEDKEDNLSVDQFSDEYDLSHQDTRILQDVQRALKFKARREARLGNKSPLRVLEKSPLHQSQDLSLSAEPALSISSPRKASVSSDLDFGPLIVASAAHPVPASLDNGETLDWSGFDDRSEGRWKLTGLKRKSRETLPPSTMLMDYQETVHADKIARLKTIISPDTSRKAKMTREQLGRRYKPIFASLSDTTPLNLIKVARWHSGQGELVRNSLEKAEPSIWLKHLDKRRGNPPNRLPWHLSALIVEEYIHAETRHNAIGMTPEDLLVPSVRASDFPSPANSQLSSTTSHASSNRILMPSLARTTPAEHATTFQPILETSGASLKTGSQNSGKSSFSLPGENVRIQEPLLRPWKKSLDNQNDSSSFSDHSDGRLAVLPSPEPDVKAVVASDQSDNDYLARASITLQVAAPTPASNSEINQPRLFARFPKRRSQKTIDRVLGRRRVVHTSLPSADSMLGVPEIRFQKEISEEKTYEHKAKLLENVATHNHRIRQLLNRISNAVREYDTTEANAMASLGNTHLGLPQELLDAFGHDPAAVTGATRRFKGWRAVDDIRNRLIRQRKVFEVYLAQSESHISLFPSVLDDPIASLMVSLDALDGYRQEITQRATQVLEILKTVQTTHAAVKKDYKETLSYTSVVYPELSYIVALEESYKDQYQQFWEFGMDTLTFILDTVTPFWRTYGKTIGQDIRDFLIIPLYRNEFTGESKRYLVRGVPARSFRHWLGLVSFFLLSVSVNVLQTRAAVSSSTHYTLPMIPYEGIRWTALPFFWICITIQWWAVVVELFMVLMQIGILAWWLGWSIGIFT